MNVQRKRFFTVVLVAIFFIVLIAISVLYFKQNINTQLKNSTPIATTSPALSADEYSAYKQKLLDVLASSSPREAMTLLTTEAQSDQNIANGCHSFAHAVGHAAFKKYNDFSEALTYLNEACNSGYIHGVIEEYFIQTKNQENALEEIKRVCASYPQGTFKSWQCYHGVGHGFMFYTENDLPKSLSLCNSFSTSFAKNSCMNGTLMENFNTTDKVHPSSYVKQDSFYPCNSTIVDDSLKIDCYAYTPNWFLSQHDNNYADTIEWCKTADPLYQSSCFYGLGNQASKNMIKDPLAVESLCTHVPKQYINDCISGMAQMHVFFNASPEAGYRICNLLQKEHKNACTSTVKGTEYLFK